ncbi:FhaA domain-containing protein [Streptomyces lateritius]|uniref:FhaA domain-containing protein n=1 Tax=Streptomyces lateritius TaxID=67313 RepID=A0ABW6YJ21_9ACTN
MAWETLTRWERALERWQRTLLEKVHLRQPVELLDALHHECDRHAVVCSKSRVVVPNAYEVELDTGVYAELVRHGCGDVGEMLTDSLARHGLQKGYEWAGPLAVHITPTPLASGDLYRVYSSPMPHVRADAFPEES